MDHVAIALFSGLVACYYCLPWLWGRYSRFALQKRCLRQKSLLLTIDDGPGSRLTPAILDILSEYNVKAVFFVLGRNIEGREDIVRRMVAEGHEIGSHGFDHPHAWKVWPWMFIRDIRKGFRAIDQAIGISGGTYAYRPPYGKLDIVSLVYLLYNRIPVVYWTTDSKDTWSWKKDSPSSKLLCDNLVRGEVLMIHDFDRSSNDRDQYVLDVVKLTARLSQTKGFRMCTFSQIGEKQQ